MNEKNFIPREKIQLPYHLAVPGATMVDLIAFRGVSTNTVEIIPQFCNRVGYKTCGNHVVGHGLIFDSIVTGYFGRIKGGLY